MPTTPEQTCLLFVKKKIKNLRKLFSKASINNIVLQNPTRRDVVSKFPKYTIVHFACHGYPTNDPSQSGLLIKDWKKGFFTFSDLVALNIESATLAYLSACHTSAMRDFRLLDESISLSSAIQLFSYPSVVSSLWQVIDSYSAEVACDIYEWILKGGNVHVIISAFSFLLIFSVSSNNCLSFILFDNSGLFQFVQLDPLLARNYNQRAVMNRTFA